MIHTGLGTCVRLDGAWRDDVQLSSFDFVLPMLALIAVNLLVIVGNVMVIAAVFTHSKLRSTTTNKFVVSLAVADLMVGLIVLPFSSVNQVLLYRRHGILHSFRDWAAISFGKTMRRRPES